jgi:hypothetical protein
MESRDLFLSQLLHNRHILLRKKKKEIYGTTNYTFYINVQYKYIYKDAYHEFCQHKRPADAFLGPVDLLFWLHAHNLCLFTFEYETQKATCQILFYLIF